jgi:hypothetical protein
VIGVMGLVVFGPFAGLFDPTLRFVGRVIGALLRSPA